MQAALTTSKVVAPVPASQSAASAPVTVTVPMASTPIIKIAIYGDDEMMGSSFSPIGRMSIVSPDEDSSLAAEKAAHEEAVIAPIIDRLIGEDL